MKATINGFEMAYDDRGEGKPVILLHGFPLCREMWEKQATALHQAGYRVITPDLRGFGESEATVDGYEMASLADDVAALMDYLKLKQAVIGGMSMGGYILLSLLENHFQRLSAALFIVTRGAADDEPGKEKRRLLAKDVKAGRPETVSAAFEKVLFATDTKEKQPEIIEKVTGWMNNTDPKALIGGLLGMAERKNYLPLLSHFALPALVIAGEEDVTIPPENSEALAESLPNAILKVLPEAGHMANLEQPEEFNRTLLGFLDKVKD